MTDPAAISAKSRQSFVSAIPRPTSGSSRHATPTGGRPAASTVRQEAEPLQIDRWHQTPSQHRDGADASPFHISHSTSRDSEFLLPYHQRPQKDLSGVQQQLHIRDWSTKPLRRPGSPVSPPHSRHPRRAGGLPKSKTTNDLLSSARDITPRRRLLQPLEPPLPRTQTLGNISCFGPTTLTPSPKKPGSVTASQPYGLHDNTSQLNVGDALVESRMTEKEVELMKQVQREAAVNRIRLRTAIQISSHRTCRTSLPTEATTAQTSKETSAITTSTKNTIIPRRPGGIQRKSASGRLLFIDSALANKAATESDLPSPRTQPSMIASSSGSLPEDISKHVYCAESLQYWTGRYVSLCDRIRNQEMQENEPLSPKDANDKRLDQLFENGENLRMYAALDELRQYCKTATALASFEDFETGLLGVSGGQPEGYHGRASITIGRIQTDKNVKPLGSGSSRPPLSWNLSQSPGNTSSPTSLTSSVNVEAVMSSGAKAFYGLGSFPKSKTTGNLASLIPTIVKKQTVPAAGPRSKPSTTAPAFHRRRTSYLDCSPEFQEKVLKDREERASRWAAEAHRRSSSRLPSLHNDETQDGIQLLSSKVPVRAHQEQSKFSESKVRTFDEVVGPLDCAMLESGHGLPPPLATEGSQASQQVQVVNVPGGGVEKVIKSRRKTERQSGGEMVKNLFGVGIREVKRMGRRVGSWAGNSEDFPSPGQR